MSDGYYSIVVRVARTDADGRTTTTLSPTFYLHENVQGLLTASQAERIAVRMIRDCLPPGDDAIVTASAFYMG